MCFYLPTNKIMYDIKTIIDYPNTLSCNSNIHFYPPF